MSIFVTNGRTLEESNIQIADQLIEFEPIKRGSRTTGHILCLSQGSIEDQTDFWIPENLIDSFIEGLQAAKEMLPHQKSHQSIESFRSEYHFLSNFALSPMTFSGKIWPTVEHVFQAAKTLDENEREQIRLAPSPGDAKKMGRRVKLRHDWERIKHTVMKRTLLLKFKQNPEFQKELSPPPGNKQSTRCQLQEENAQLKKLINTAKDCLVCAGAENPIEVCQKSLAILDGNLPVPAKEPEDDESFNPRM
jgi:hypothetical protein